MSPTVSVFMVASAAEEPWLRGIERLLLSRLGKEDEVRATFCPMHLIVTNLHFFGRGFLCCGDSRVGRGLLALGSVLRHRDLAR